MSLTGEAINYLQKRFPNASFLKDIILQDDGNGPYIKSWGLSDPKPTEEELNAAGQRPQDVVYSFPTVEEGFKLLYDDMKNNTKTFIDRMDKVGKAK